MLLPLFIACNSEGSIKNPVNKSPWNQDKNIYLKDLQICGLQPMTGFLRNGYCQTNELDEGVHTVCVKISNQFLKFSLANGNDLITPKKGFPGLKPGDKWCICADWWKAADLEGVAPNVDLDATHLKSLLYINKNRLLRQKAEKKDH